MNETITARKYAPELDTKYYKEKCVFCQSPARTEVGQQTADPLHGVETYQVCVNRYCKQFDRESQIVNRERMIEMWKESTTYKRYRRRLWEAYNAEYRAAQRARRAALA